MNFDNRTLFIADNLDIMRGMDSETVDLIYLEYKKGKTKGQEKEMRCRAFCAISDTSLLICQNRF